MEIKTDIREYCEEEEVKIIKEDNRYVIYALNEGGYNATMVDLLDVIEWYEKNKDKLK